MVRWGLWFSVERFDIFLATMASGASSRPVAHGHRFANEAGLAFVLLGVAMTVVAAIRFSRIAKQIDKTETVPSSGSLFDLALAILLVLLGLSLFLYLSRSVLPLLRCRTRGDRSYERTSWVDHFCVDCSANGDVRRLFAWSTHQSGQRPDTNSNQLFRAGHAHAGVLTPMSLLYYFFLDQTSAIGR
jgi:uncharacterized membrane protein YidH (DUF202 family)